MKLTNKNIRRISFWSPLIFGVILGIVMSSIFDMHYYQLSYWVITIPIQLYYNSLNEKFTDILYKVKENRRLRFKEFVKEKEYVNV